MCSTFPLKVEQWFRERREHRQATIDVVDIEEEEGNISDDEERKEKFPAVKEQRMKLREVKESERERKISRNVERKRSNPELEALKNQVAKLTKDLEKKNEKERDAVEWKAKHESIGKVLEEKEIEVKNLRTMNEALSKRSEKEREANAWKSSYEDAMKTIEERDATIDNLETMNETLDKSQGEIIKALKMKLAVEAKELIEHENCAMVLKQEKERANASLQQKTQKLTETEERLRALSSEKVPEMMAKFREKLERKEEEVGKLKAEVDLHTEVEGNLAKRVEQTDLENKDLEQKLLEVRKVMIEKDGMIAKARKSKESESKLARLRFQILDLKDEMLLQKKDQELIIADTEKLIKEVVNLKSEIKTKDGLLQSKTTESAEFKDIQMNMMNAMKSQKKVIMKAENQEKIIENQKMMLTQLKQQSQTHLAQISRLTEVQRISLNNTPTPEASLLKRELKRRTDQLTQMRAELLRAQQTNKDSTSMTKAGPHLAMAGFQTIGIEEAVKEYERIVNKAKIAEEVDEVEIVNLEEEVVCQPDIYPYGEEDLSDNTNTVISEAENVLKNSATVLNSEQWNALWLKSNTKEGSGANLQNDITHELTNELGTKDKVEVQPETTPPVEVLRGSFNKEMDGSRQCNICGRVFLDENYLKKHQTKAHMVDLYKRPPSPAVITQTSQKQERPTVQSLRSESNSKRRHPEDESSKEQTDTIGVDQNGGPLKRVRLVGKSESFSETSGAVVMSILDTLICNL